MLIFLSQCLDILNPTSVWYDEYMGPLDNSKKRNFQNVFSSLDQGELY